MQSCVQWYCENVESGEATQEDWSLINKVFGYEERKFFDDMLFKPGTDTYSLTQCMRCIRRDPETETEEWINSSIDMPTVDTEYKRYKVKPLEDLLGYYDKQEQLLCVSPEGLENGYTILHEMIHMYEEEINEYPMYYHDMLLWGLYQSLKKRIPKLDDIISNHAHVLTGSTLYDQGGLHDIVFLLKSFDLDIRMGYSLGTVFGYGRDETFKDFEYLKEDQEKEEP